jgi:hypothetical protein
MKASLYVDAKVSAAGVRNPSAMLVVQRVAG